MRVIIIGGGASGLMVASHIKNHEVILIEKNEKLGKKIYITGKGRCNVTNNVPPNEFIEHIVRNRKFLYSSLSLFSSKDTIDFFESRGVPLVTERGNRVFPKSYRASDIIKVLEQECIKNKVDIHLNEEVYRIKYENNQFIIKTDKQEYLSDILVIATGGKSYPLTGSTGDGYRFLESLNHHITPLYGGLNAIRIQETFPKEMLKLNLKNISLEVISPQYKKKLEGEIIIETNKLDGPLINTISSYINRLDPKEIKFKLDLKPNITKEELLSNPRSNLYVLLQQIIPTPMIYYIVMKLKEYDKRPLKQVDDRLIKNIAHLLKNLEYQCLGLDYLDHAIITSGGQDILEINPKTMESKLLPNLYVIGELLDIGALTGGFNLQIAFTTAIAASISISNK